MCLTREHVTVYCWSTLLPSLKWTTAEAIESDESITDVSRMVWKRSPHNSVSWTTTRLVFRRASLVCLNEVGLSVANARKLLESIAICDIS